VCGVFGDMVLIVVSPFDNGIFFFVLLFFLGILFESSTSVDEIESSLLLDGVLIRRLTSSLLPSVERESSLGVSYASMSAEGYPRYP